MFTVSHCVGEHTPALLTEVCMYIQSMGEGLDLSTEHVKWDLNLWSFYSGK